MTVFPGTQVTGFDQLHTSLPVVSSQVNFALLATLSTSNDGQKWGGYF